MLTVTTQTHITLAAAHLEHADLCITSVAENLHLDRCSVDGRRANNNVSGILGYQEYVRERDFLALLTFQRRHMELVPYGDFFLEAGNINNGKHVEYAESWGNLQNNRVGRKKILANRNAFCREKMGQSGYGHPS